MSSFGFHAEHARETRSVKRRVRRHDDDQQVNPASIRPPTASVQSSNNYSRDRSVRGTSIGERRFGGGQSRKSHEPPPRKVLSSKAPTRDPVGLNDFTSTYNNRNQRSLALRRRPQGRQQPDQNDIDDTNISEYEEPNFFVEQPDAQPEPVPRDNQELRALQEGLDKLRVELQREKLARKKLEVSIKSNCEELSVIRQDGNLEAGGNYDEIRRELDDNVKQTNQKMSELVKTVQEQLDVLIQEVDDVKNATNSSCGDELVKTVRESKNLKNELDTALSEFHDLLYWNYGQVVHDQGIDVINPKDGNVVAHRDQGDWVLLHPPMSSKDNEVFMNCRVVDESSGESVMGKTCLMKGNDEIFISNFKEYVR